MGNIVNNGAQDAKAVITVDISGNYVAVGAGSGTSTTVNALSGAVVLSGLGNIAVTTAGQNILISGTDISGVSGPGSSTNRNLALWNGTTGSVLLDGGVTVSTSGIFTVPNNGGFVSAAAGQVIAVSASSGVTIGGGNGNISLGTTDGQVSLSTSQGANQGTLSVYPDTVVMTQNAGGVETYIQLSASNPIITKGNFRPITSGTDSIGIASFPYASGNFNNLYVGGAGVRGTIYNEVPGGLVNGVNATFTLARAPYMPNIAIYASGAYMTPSGVGATPFHYSVSGTGVTFVTAPASGITLLANYQF